MDLQTDEYLTCGETWVAVTAISEIRLHWLAERGLLPPTGLVMNRPADGFHDFDWGLLYLNDTTAPVAASRRYGFSRMEVIVDGRTVALPPEKPGNRSLCWRWRPFEALGCLKPAKALDTIKAGILSQRHVTTLEETLRARRNGLAPQ